MDKSESTSGSASLDKSLGKKVWIKWEKSNYKILGVNFY